jgi:large subunit ribosomal protein L4
MNRKEKQAALKSVLTSKVQENKFLVLDELKFDAPKTKEMKKVIDALKVEKALVIVGKDSDNAVLSARNLEGVATASAETINVYDLLKYNTVIATKSSVAAIEEVYA